MEFHRSHDASPRAARPGHLLRILGLGFGLAVIIGNTIGAGILRTPGVVAESLPNAWLFVGVWVLGGLYALLGAFAVSELSAMVPRSGGYFVFARRALGDYPGFAIGWTDWMAQLGSIAAVAIVIGEYTGDLVPALREHTIATAIAVAVGVALLQWRGLRWGSTAQTITSALKALGFVGLVAALFALAEPAPASSSIPAPAATAGVFVGLVLALQAVIYTYDGWYVVIYFGDELRNPARDAPRSTFHGVLALTAIYVLVALALVYALSVSGIAGQNLALATAATSIFGERGDTIVRVLVIVSMLAGINAFHLMACRIPHAMSADGLLPRAAAHVNPGGTPAVTLFWSTVVAVAFISLSAIDDGRTSPFERAIGITAFFFVVNYVVVYLAFFVLRRREPDTPRPYRAWGYPWTTGLALAGSVVFLVAAIIGDTANSFWALAVLGASYPLYRVMSKLSA